MKTETLQATLAVPLGIGGAIWMFNLLDWQISLAIFLMVWGFSLELKAMISREKRHRQSIYDHHDT